MSGQWMIYGANGYTGRLAARLAKLAISVPFWPAATPDTSSRLHLRIVSKEAGAVVPLTDPNGYHSEREKEPEP